MTTTKKQPAPESKFPNKWAGDFDDFNFNPGGRPAAASKESGKPKPTKK